MKVKLKNILYEFSAIDVDIVCTDSGKVSLTSSEVLNCANMLSYGYTYENECILNGRWFFKCVPYDWGNRYVKKFTYNNTNSKVTIVIKKKGDN